MRRIKRLLLIVILVASGALGFGLGRHSGHAPRDIATPEIKVSLDGQEFRQGSQALLVTSFTHDQPIPRNLVASLRLHLVQPDGLDQGRPLIDPEEAVIAVSGDGCRMTIAVPLSAFAADSYHVSMQGFQLDFPGEHALCVSISSKELPQTLRSSWSSLRSSLISLVVIPRNLETVLHVPAPLTVFQTRNS